MVDSRGRLALIHNGIIENFLPLKKRLLAEGWTFKSDTDTEVVANLISSYLDGDLRAAVAAARSRSWRGCTPSPWSAPRRKGRRSSPPARGRRWSLGLARASSSSPPTRPPCCAYTKDVIFLENGDIARLTPAGIEIQDRAGNRSSAPRPAPQLGPRSRPRRAATSTSCSRRSTSSRRSCRRPSRGRVDFESGDDPPRHAQDLPRGGRADRAPPSARLRHLVARGADRQVPDREIARLPVEVDYGSEYRYRDPIVSRPRARRRHLAVGRDGGHPVGHGGRRASAARGCSPICNVVGSQATRDQRRGDLHATPAPRSASPRPRRSPPSSWPSTCSPSTCGRAATGALERHYLDELTRLPQAVDEVIRGQESAHGRAGPQVPRARRTSSTSAAGSTTRSPSRGR